MYVSVLHRPSVKRLLAIVVLSVRPSVRPSVLVSRRGTDPNPGEIENPGSHLLLLTTSTADDLSLVPTSMTVNDLEPNK